MGMSFVGVFAKLGARHAASFRLGAKRPASRSLVLGQPMGQLTLMNAFPKLYLDMAVIVDWHKCSPSHKEQDLLEKSFEHSIAYRRDPLEKRGHIQWIE
jgi:hypothetical protein